MRYFGRGQCVAKRVTFFRVPRSDHVYVIMEGDASNTGKLGVSLQY